MARAMASTTVSSRYQGVIPKEVREELGIKHGQKLQVIVLGGVIHLVPVRSLNELQGFVKGIDTSDIRDERDRYLLFLIPAARSTSSWRVRV